MEEYYRKILFAAIVILFSLGIIAVGKMIVDVLTRLIGG